MEGTKRIWLMGRLGSVNCEGGTGDEGVVGQEGGGVGGRLRIVVGRRGDRCCTTDWKGTVKRNYVMDWFELCGLLFYIAARNNNTKKGRMLVLAVKVLLVGGVGGV